MTEAETSCCSVDVRKPLIIQLESPSLRPAISADYARIQKPSAQRDATGAAAEEPVRTFRWMMYELKLMMGFQGIEAATKLLLDPNIVWSSAVLTRVLPAGCVGLGFMTVLFALGHQLVKRSLDL